MRAEYILRWIGFQFQDTFTVINNFSISFSFSSKIITGDRCPPLTVSDQSTLFARSASCSQRRQISPSAAPCDLKQHYRASTKITLFGGVAFNRGSVKPRGSVGTSQGFRQWPSRVYLSKMIFPSIRNRTNLWVTNDRVAILQTKKLLEFYRRNCRQYVEQMHIS